MVFVGAVAIVIPAASAPPTPAPVKIHPFYLSAIYLDIALTSTRNYLHQQSIFTLSSLSELLKTNQELLK